MNHSYSVGRYDVDYRNEVHYVNREGQLIGLVMINTKKDLTQAQLSGFYGWAKKQSDRLPFMSIMDKGDEDVHSYE